MVPLTDTPGLNDPRPGLRDQAAEFEQLECVVLGASFDHTEANRAFRQKFDFPFRLLSDWDEQVGVIYEVRPQDREGEVRQTPGVLDRRGRGPFATRTRSPTATPFAGDVLTDLRRLQTR